MTPEELRTLILSDETATAAAIAGDDVACAARCTSIAPRLIVETLIGELGVFKLAADPVAAETVLQTIEAIAEQNPVVKRMLKWMQPGAPGIDFGDPRVREVLTLPVESGGLGLTTEQAAPLLAAAERPQQITAEQVGQALRPLRSEDRAGAEFWLGGQ